MHMIATAMIASLATFAPVGLGFAGPPKAVARVMAPAHAKAGPTLPAKAALPVPHTAIFPVRPRSASRLALQHISPYVDVVPMLPGERFPLRALTPTGQPLAVSWRTQGGQLSWGDKIAVWQAPLEAGAYPLRGHTLIKGRLVQRTLTMVVTVPAGLVREGRLNGYPIGSYPKGFGPADPLVAILANRGARDAYEVPMGFIELSAKNVDTAVSEHYKLRDFAGKDGWANGKKYMFLDTRLVEKLERLIYLMRAEGYDIEKLRLMSAYRSPALNAAIGNVTRLSRHTYGDAADMLAEDFNRDGKADMIDAKILLAAITHLDTHSELTGGACIYPPNSAHGYFVHTDARGSLVRW